MYEKNLTEDFRLRLSSDDMNFLRELSKQRNNSVSECLRSIIGEYRRSLDAMNTLKEALATINAKKGELLSNGDTETNLDNIV